MTWVAAAIGASAVVGGGASVLASNSQKKAAKNANNTQLQMFNQNRADMAPWRDSGGLALRELSYELGLGGGSGAGPLSYEDWLAQGAPVGSASSGGKSGLSPSLSLNPLDPVTALTGGLPVPKAARNALGKIADPLHIFGHKKKKAKAADLAATDAANRAAYAQYQSEFAAAHPAFDPANNGALNRQFTLDDFNTDPGYQFRQQQGEQAINRNALARGRYNSGGTLKELQRYNSGLASDEYGNAWNRWNTSQTNRYNRLAGLAGVGQQATSSVNADRSSTAANIAGNQLSAGNAASAGIVGGANAINSALGTGLNYWQNQQYLNALKKPSGLNGSWV